METRPTGLHVGTADLYVKTPFRHSNSSGPGREWNPDLRVFMWASPVYMSKLRFDTPTAAIQVGNGILLRRFRLTDITSRISITVLLFYFAVGAHYGNSYK